MFYELLTRDVSFVSEIDPYYTKLVVEQVSDGETFSRQSVFKKSSAKDSLGNIKASDFSLNSILAVGAYDMLKPIYAPDVNALNVVSQVEEAIKSFKPSDNE